MLEKYAVPPDPSSVPDWGVTFAAGLEGVYELPADVQDAQRRAAAVACGLEETASPEEITERQVRLAAERYRQHKLELGLPEDASVAEVLEAERERVRLLKARELGLPDDASTADIAAVLRERETADRRARALSLGIDSDSDFETIHAAELERTRKRLAEENGLDPDTSMDAIFDVIFGKSND